jgi:insertion element IS1 protein InsB
VDLYRQKKDACWLWWAVDRASKSVLGWTLGDRGTETAERLAAQLPYAPQVKFATDFWHPYAKIFCGQNHVQGKAHTFTIESLNNRNLVLSGPPQAPDAQLQQVQGKSGRQHPVLYRQQMWRGTGTNDAINTYLAIPNSGLLSKRRGQLMFAMDNIFVNFNS